MKDHMDLAPFVIEHLPNAPFLLGNRFHVIAQILEEVANNMSFPFNTRPA